MEGLPPFNPHRNEEVKEEPGKGDDVPCVKCGAALDTGLECTECGYDNYEVVTGRPFCNTPQKSGPKNCADAIKKGG